MLPVRASRRILGRRHPASRRLRPGPGLPLRAPASSGGSRSSLSAFKAHLHPESGHEPLVTMDARSEITAILVACRSGGDDLCDRLLPLVYDQLRSVAHAQLSREPPGPTLNTTALVHE